MSSYAGINRFRFKRSRSSYGFGLNQGVTWYPFISHLGLFKSEHSKIERERPGPKAPVSEKCGGEQSGDGPYNRRSVSHRTH